MSFFKRLRDDYKIKQEIKKARDKALLTIQEDKIIINAYRYMQIYIDKVRNDTVKKDDKKYLISAILVLTEGINKIGDRPKLYVARGEAQYLAGLTKEGLKDIKKAMKIDPNNKQAQNAYNNIKELENGIASDFIELALAPFSARAIPEIKKIADEKASEREEFLKELELKIEKDPDNPDLYLTSGLAYRPGNSHIMWTSKQKEDSLRAESDFKKAIRIQPDSVEAHLNLGMLLMAMRWQIPEREDAPSQAEFEFKEVIRLNPNFQEAYRILGKLYYYLKRYEEAREQLELTLKMNPSDELALLLLGNTFLHLERTVEATNIFKKIFSEYDPSLHKIETASREEYYSLKVKNLEIVLKNNIDEKWIKSKEVKDFNWIQ